MVAVVRYGGRDRRQGPMGHQPVSPTGTPWWSAYLSRRLARWAARGAAYGGGGAGLLGAVGYGLLKGEAKLARRGIRPPETTPVPAAYYGPVDAPGQPLRLAVLGDSSAAGTGCVHPDETPGALFSSTLAAETGRLVEVDVLAVVGSRSADLEPQVARALLHPPQVAVISIGANDVTHGVSIPAAVASLAHAVRRLRAAGVAVVVGTCPDLGAVAPIRQPLRTVAHYKCRRMAAAQHAAVVAADGIPVALGEQLAERFAADSTLFCQDRFHPSAAGYALIVAAGLPAVRAAAGIETAAPTAVETTAKTVAEATAATIAEEDDGPDAARPSATCR